MSWLVIIVREGVAATEIDDEDTAKVFYDQHSQQWTESYLCEVVAGPGKPIDTGDARMRLMKGVWDAAMEHACELLTKARFSR